MLKISRLLAVPAIFVSVYAASQTSSVRKDWIPISEATSIDGWGYTYIVRNSGPVGLLWNGSVSCTGVLVGEELFLTASHCVAQESCPQTKVEFMQQSKRVPSRVRSSSCVELVHVCGSKENDYQSCDHALLRLNKSPGRYHGFSKLATRRAETDEEVISFHHPRSIFKVASVGTSKFSLGGIIYHDIPIDEGSSGAPIYNSEGEVVAIQSKGKDNPFETPSASDVTSDRRLQEILGGAQSVSQSYGSQVWSGFSAEQTVNLFTYNSPVGDVDMMRLEALVRWVDPSGIGWVFSQSGGFISEFSIDGSSIYGTGGVYNWGFNKQINPKWLIGIQGQVLISSLSGTIDTGSVVQSLDRNLLFTYGVKTELCRPGIASTAIGTLHLCAHAAYQRSLDDESSENEFSNGSSDFLEMNGAVFGVAVGLSF